VVPNTTVLLIIGVQPTAELLKKNEGFYLRSGTLRNFAVQVDIQSVPRKSALISSIQGIETK
jgi:hypothetical protein